MLDIIRQSRLQKVKTLRDLGVSPYVSARAGTFRTNTAKQIKSEFEKFEGKQVTVVGKIVLLRNIGKIAFATIQDETERIQLFFKEGDVTELEHWRSDELATTKKLNLSNKFIQKLSLV